MNSADKERKTMMKRDIGIKMIEWREAEDTNPPHEDVIVVKS